MDAVEYYQDYIAHFGTKGQSWGLRRYQSYETAPTRSGMVGQEVGEAAKQSERLTKEEKQEAKAEKWRQKEIKKVDKIYEQDEKYAEANASLAGVEWLRNPTQANLTKAQNAAKIHQYASIMRQDAVQSVKNMSIKDIKKEKMNRAKDVLTSIGFGGLMVGAGAATSAINPVTGALTSAIGLAYVPSNIYVNRDMRRRKRAEEEYNRRLYK